MERYIRFIQQISSLGAVFGGIILVFIMLLTVASVLFRIFGNAIVGSYELTELVIVVTIGFALVYSTMTRANVAVHIFYDRFSPSVQKMINIFIAALSLGFWGWMAWETLRMTIDRGWMERSEVFLFPLLPFRLIWVLGLGVLTLLLLALLTKGIFGRANK
ncbi:MAG: TRAP transporter small permease [Deltaproteobacteria bacterium]|nr:TRAP transporter small permease [Deltaproteobacteria bacterium]